MISTISKNYDPGHKRLNRYVTTPSFFVALCYSVNMIKDAEDQIVSQHSFDLISQKSSKLNCKYSIILIRSAC